MDETRRARTVRLDPDVAEGLRERAHELRVPENTWINQALRYALAAKRRQRVTVTTRTEVVDL